MKKLLFLNFFISSLVEGQVSTTLIKKLEKTTFLIEVYNNQKTKIATGSGFFIDRTGTCITNLHVIKDAYSASIITNSGAKFSVDKVLAFNTDMDIAKFTISSGGTTFPFVTIYKNPPEKGTEVLAIGSPLGLSNTISTGIISAVREIEPYGKCFQITAPISPGSSGGALFDNQGNLIGITSFNLQEGQNLNFAIDAKLINRLNQNLNLTLANAQNNVRFESYILKALNSKEQGDYEEAIAYIDKELSINSSNHDALFLKASIEFERGNYNVAKSLLEVVISSSKNNSLLSNSYRALGIIYRDEGDIDKALQQFKSGLEYDSTNFQIYCSCGILYEKKHLMNDAYSHYFKAVQLNPNSCPDGQIALGLMLIKTGKPTEGIRAIKHACDLRPDKISFASLGYAYSMEQINNYEAAKKVYLKMLELFGKEDTDIQYSIAACDLVLGNKVDACSRLKQCKIYLGHNTDARVDEAIQANCQ